MNPYTYRIRFLLIHPNMDFTATKNELEKVSGLNGGRTMNFGDARTMHTGAPLEGAYQDSRWGFDFETTDEWTKSETKSAADSVDEMLTKLEPHKSVFTDLAKVGCKIELIISIGVESNTSEAFSPELMRRLSGFEICLAVDLYPPDAK